MAKHLTEQDVNFIVGLIDGWEGKLTWDKLCERAAVFLGVRMTRQTFNSHLSIKNAFVNKKSFLLGEVKDIKIPQSLTMASQRISRLESENQRLKAENERLLLLFITWQYNAHKRGLSRALLDEPLPRIDRDSSE